MEDLSVRIAGLHILQGVSFTVAPTGVTVLLGRNGVGKTTTLRAILGLTPPQRRGARHHPDGRAEPARAPHPPAGPRRARLRARGPLRLRRAHRRGEPAAGRAAGHHPGYDKVFALFPELDRRGRQRAGSLSGGQQQMLAIGRVLLNDNRLLLVDEPTKGLAPKVVTEVAEVLERVAESVPVLLVEQNLAVVRRLARDAVVLAAGQVAWTGDAPRAAAGRPALTRSLLGVGSAAGARH